MAIDREMYEKYSGRRVGEAESRLGEGLAQRSERLQGMKAWQSRSFQERYLIVGLGWELICFLGGAMILAGFALWKLIF